MMNIVNTIEFMVKDINKYLDDITLNANLKDIDVLITDVPLEEKYRKYFKPDIKIKYWESMTPIIMK